MKNKEGIVYLVGAGPGDAGLLTQRGAELLKRAEVVLYDRLVNPLLLKLAPEDSERISVGKNAGNHSLSQEEINELIIKKAGEGKRVVRLKGGDPFVFGRGGEEALALEKAGIPYEVAPGVTSAVAALAAAGIPVTHRGEARSFHVITGHTLEPAGGQGGMNGRERERFIPYGALEGTLIFLMAVSELSVITGGLVEGGKSGDTPASLVEQGTTIRQRRIDGTLASIAELGKKNGIEPPAILVVGEAASFRLTSGLWPLSGRKIAVTGTAELVAKVKGGLKELGAQIYEAPYLSTVPTDALSKRQPVFREFSWLVFTSANGVRQFFEQMKAAGRDIREISACKFAVIGPGTGEALWQYGIRPDYMPGLYTVEELAEGTARLVCSGGKLLALRAREGAAALTAVWEKSRVPYEDLGIYETVTDFEEAERLIRQMDVLDTVVFASASGVRAFFEAGEASSVSVRESLPERLVCIGPRTEEALRKRIPEGEWGRIRTASEYTAGGLVRACLDDQNGIRKEGDMIYGKQDEETAGE